jgi:hypothetical protein
MTMRSANQPFLLRLAGILAALLGFSGVVSAEDLGVRVKELAGRMHNQATQMAVLAGEKPDPTGSIECASNLGVCTCSGAIDCAILAWICGEAGGIQGFDGECHLPDIDPAGKDVLSRGKTLVAQVRQANTIAGGGRTERIGELTPAVRAFEADLHGLAVAAALAAGEPPPPASITCTWDFFHCGCDNAIDCAWLSWFCAAAGGVSGFEGGCYLPDLAPGAELLLRDAEQLKQDAQKQAVCR